MSLICCIFVAHKEYIIMTIKRFYFLLFTLCVANFLFAAAPVKRTHKASSAELTMLVGTYTEGSSSKGIYVYRFNQDNGTSKYVSYVKVNNPSYVTAADNNRFAYSVSEYGNGKATANAFKLDKTAGKLSFINSQLTADKSKGGEDPCYIIVYKNHVITANYSGGDITVFPVKSNGGLSPVSERYSFNGTKAGAVAHLHCVRISPDGKYLFADDLGDDCIYRFNVNDAPNSSSFLSDCKVVFNGKKGMGPRHLTFSNNGKFAYLINELGGIVVAFSYNKGELKPIQTIMADEGEGHGSADIHISPDGRFLYTSHRLKKDGVAIFSINSTTGIVTKVGYQTTGIHPRNFIITPNGKFLLVACRDSNVIEIYRRNLKNGLLTKAGNDIAQGKPVCLQFLK